MAVVERPGSMSLRSGGCDALALDSPAGLGVRLPSLPHWAWSTRPPVPPPPPPRAMILPALPPAPHTRDTAAAQQACGGAGERDMVHQLGSGVWALHVGQARLACVTYHALGPPMAPVPQGSRGPDGSLCRCPSPPPPPRSPRPHAHTGRRRLPLTSPPLRSGGCR